MATIGRASCGAADAVDCAGVAAEAGVEGWCGGCAAQTAVAAKNEAISAARRITGGMRPPRSYGRLARNAPFAEPSAPHARGHLTLCSRIGRRAGPARGEVHQCREMAATRSAVAAAGATPRTIEG